MLCARFKMMIESFVRWWVLGSFSMIPHVFSVFSIGFGFNVCCVCVFVCSVLSWCLLNDIKVRVLKAKRKIEQRSQFGF